jgi:hypothetical protein
MMKNWIAGERLKNEDLNANFNGIANGTELEPSIITNAMLSTDDGELGGAWLDWIPTVTAGGSMTVSSVSVVVARYIQIGKMIYFTVRLSMTTGGTADNDILFTLPVATKDTTNTVSVGNGFVTESATVGAFAFSGSSGTVADCRKYDASNFGLGAGKIVAITGHYEVA